MMPGTSVLSRCLTAIEWLGNKLPDPVFLFVGGTVLVILLSGAGASLNWSVQPVRPVVVTQTTTDASGASVKSPVLDESGRPKIELVESGSPVRPRSLLTGEGLYWLVSNLVRNFINFAPLGVVLVSVLGIGVAERVGLFVALMRFLASIVPAKTLTPMVLILGMLSHLASDAGYIILPPLAAALYAAAGRPPIAGIATAFAGVAGGFAANFFVGSSDALISPLTERAARLLDPNYVVLPTCNWYFLAASTMVLMATGWLVTAKVVEPRLAAADAGLPTSTDLLKQESEVTPAQKRGLAWAGCSALVAIIIVTGLIAIPGAPLAGNMPAPAPAFGPIPSAVPAPDGQFVPGQKNPTNGTMRLSTPRTFEATDADGARGVFRSNANTVLEGKLEPPVRAQPRWSQAIVPCIFFVFLVPGLVYGLLTGAIKSLGDISKAFIDSMVSMAPVIVMAFFAAQFVEAFRYSNLDAMIANAGGKTLAAADLPTPVLVVAVIFLVIVLDIVIASMSAKWTAMAPILVPMLMMAGMSPELTQVAYRIGDSVVNVVTPLNSYIIVILACLQRYRPKAGIGNLISLMLPYSFAFFVVWTLFLLAWTFLDLPLGPGAKLWYVPGH